MLKSLNVAQSGLNAAKIAVENVSNNIANENTPGYKKRVVQLSELELIDGRMTGRGVRADEAYRITSQYMFDNMMNENSKSNYYDEISSMVGNIEAMFQETDTSGFSSDFDRFFQSVENLRSNPNSEIYRTTFKTQGTVLVDSLQNLYSNIEKQEKLTLTSLEDNVEKVNNLVNEIGAINQQLGQHIEASNDLLDKRDELEKELSKYVDIEVDRSNNEYSLKVGGAIAVRFNTNIREINLVEENITQIDRFSTNPTSGAPQDAISDKFGTPALGDKITYKLNNEFSITVEVGSNQYTDNNGNTYDIDIDDDGTADTVDATNYVRALSFAINSNSNISEKVVAFNGNYELDQDGNKVDNLTSDDFLLVEARFAGEDGKFQGRIVVEKPNLDVGDVFTYNANGNNVSVSIGDMYDSDNDTIADTVIDETNYVEALVVKINADPALSADITASGTTASGFSVALAGTNTDLGSTAFTSVAGSSEKDFESGTLFKDDYQSREGQDKVYLSVYESEVNISSGIIKAQTENLTTNAAYNKIIDYKNKLDDFARAISDVYDKYVKTGTDEYEYGHVATDEYNGTQNIKNLNLFSGTDVKSLKFNENAVNDLVQSDLDYMGTLQWKKDVEFDGFSQNGSSKSATSFSEFYQEIRINISSDKENNDFLLEAQEAVEQSLQFSYDKLTKVDNDEEMVNLIKFQAAYTANAKIITVVDEMLNTILGIR